MELMYVICFYWQGDRWQTDITNSTTTDPRFKRALELAGDIPLSLASRYVNNLYHGVKHNASRPFKFVCFTNEPLEVHNEIELRTFPMLTDKGVLPRVYMFAPEAGLADHQVLCIDLDVIVVGSLQRLMDYQGLFCARSKFKPGEKWKLDGDIMSFRAGDEAANLFWDPFIANVDAAVELTGGRERYWMRHVAGGFADRWDVVAPGAVRSYKWDVRGKRGIPEGTSIVSCHGHPRPHQIKDEWIRDYWI